METKQTAVEWLINEYKIQGFLYDLDIESAKEIEKEQIKNALKAGISIGFDDNDEYMSEKYFNINYGK